ncbi:PepSY-like domain-containing protein [Flavobacterium sp. FlaQc-50]|jgi:hypothetical protein|uniref:PepSY-like domain-containing protein n=1 Tax=unclassified Flavobacterium TaxID=196869 RepID=UPI003756E54C
MKTTLLLPIIILALLLCTTACRKDHNQVLIINSAELPVAATTFISTYFPDTAYQQIKKRKTTDSDDFVYEVKLAINFKLNFDSNGNWMDIDGNHQTIPVELIPEKINSYMAENYPNAFITYIDKEKTHVITELSNDLALTFDLQGNFTRIDY